MSQILGALFAILIGIISIPTYISYQNQSNENLRISATAKQAIIFNGASSAYAQQNSVAIQAAATATVPAVITVAMLQATNNLDASFSSTNAYGQTWQLQILEPIAGSLQALALTTGGQALTDKVVTKIASVIGSAGGFLPLNDSGIYVGGSANAYGAFGGFTVPTSNYTGITGGKLASLLTFNNGQLTDNRLYRNAVPGQPQLNTMNTPLIMASTQVLNAACATSGAISQDGSGVVISCQSGTWQKQGSAYWKDPVATFAILPVCNAASIWQTRIVQTPTTGTGARAYTCNGSSWNALAVNDSGNMAIPALSVGTVQVTTVASQYAACTPNGNVAQDGNGQLLSCQLGKWGKAVKSSQAYRYAFNTTQTWTVPTGVTSAFVTMAAGGGSGAGWRMVNTLKTGHSGGYVFSQPVNLVEGEVMTITVGTGGQAFGAVFSGVPASPGPPYYIYNAPSGDDGLGGYPGTSSMLYSPTLGTILRCDGGSGSAFNGVDSFGGSKVAGNLNGALTGSGSPSFSTPNRIATGPFATVDGPGACGASLYGVGNRGEERYYFTSGNISGGSTPFGYGSGGDVVASGCYVTATSTGTCVQPQPGRNGVVFIDVLY